MRPLPASLESEMAVIGCCVCDAKCLSDCIESGLMPASFYDMRNGFWFEQLTKCETPDIIVLVEKTRSHELFDRCGGIAYLSACQDAAHSTANLPAWLKIVKEKELLRRLYGVCQSIATRVYNAANVEELLSAAESEILSIRPARTDAETMPQLVQDALNRIERIMTKKEITGLPTGFTDIDVMTDGLQPGDFIVPAAYPGFGKSTLAANIIVHNALRGVPCAYLTGEMMAVKIVMRSIASESKVNFKDRLERDMPKLVTPSHRLAKAPWHVENIAGMSIAQVRAKARRLRQKHGIRLIAVDYLQLITAPDTKTREEEVAEVALGIKAMAMELGIPVIAPSQLNDDGKLRESRAIGQHADGVWCIEPSGDANGYAQPVTLQIKKNREGETGPVNLVFLKNFTRFESVSKISDEDFPPSKPYAD